MKVIVKEKGSRILILDRLEFTDIRNFSIIFTLTTLRFVLYYLINFTQFIPNPSGIFALWGIFPFILSIIFAFSLRRTLSKLAALNRIVVDHDNVELKFFNNFLSFVKPKSFKIEEIREIIIRRHIYAKFENWEIDWSNYDPDVDEYKSRHHKSGSIFGGYLQSGLPKSKWSFQLLIDNQFVNIFSHETMMHHKEKFKDYDTYAYYLAIYLEKPIIDVTGMNPISIESTQLDKHLIGKLMQQGADSEGHIVDTSEMYEIYYTDKSAKIIVDLKKVDFDFDRYTGQPKPDDIGDIREEFIIISIMHLALLAFIIYGFISIGPEILFGLLVYAFLVVGTILHINSIENWRIIRIYRNMIEVERKGKLWRTSFKKTLLKTLNNIILYVLRDIPPNMLPSIDGKYRITDTFSFTEMSASSEKQAIRELKNFEGYDSVEALQESYRRYGIELVGLDLREPIYGYYKKDEAEKLRGFIEGLLVKYGYANEE